MAQKQKQSVPDQTSIVEEINAEKELEAESTEEVLQSVEDEGEIVPDDNEWMEDPLFNDTEEELYNSIINDIDTNIQISE